MFEYILPQTSVVQSYMSHLEKFPASESKIGLLQEDDMNFIDIYNTILKQFLIWRLETTETELITIMETYKRIKHKSLKYISWTLDILEHDVGLSKEKILKNGYLIHSYPRNTLDTLERVPVLCGRDIRTVLKQYPKITMTATDTLLEIVKLLKTHNIPDEAVYRRFDIFTLGSDSVSKRLQKMNQVPELRPYVDNPRVIQLVHYQNKANERLLQLQEMQRQCVSLHILTSTKAIFDRYTQDGEDRTRGSDIVSFLSQKLDVDTASVRKIIQRHPFWCNVALKSLLKTHDLLVEMGYGKSDLLENLHLLLYPCHQIEQVLASLPSRTEIMDAQKLMESSPWTNSKSVILTKTLELALCLYFLEKEHHFTGNGIWLT